MPLPERKQRPDDWFHMIVNTSPAATTVLIVEDDFLIRDCAADVLTECGFHVLQASNGPDAMVVLEEAHVDVIFTDVNMPGAFDGHGLAQRVRRRWPDIAIVITSGRGCPDRCVEGALFVPKPYMFDTIARVIADAASRAGEPTPSPKLDCFAG